MLADKERTRLDGSRKSDLLLLCSSLEPKFRTYRPPLAAEPLIGCPRREAALTV